MVNNPNALVTREQKVEMVRNIFDKEVSPSKFIFTTEELNKLGINISDFFPPSYGGKFGVDDIAWTVKEGQLYDLIISGFKVIPLTYPEERRNNHFTQRYLILKGSPLAFKFFIDLRDLNTQIIAKDNGIWAYKNDSELRSGVEDISNRMVTKMQAEQAELMKKRGGTIIAFQAACTASTEVTHEMMEILIKELELPKF